MKRITILMVLTVMLGFTTGVAAQNTANAPITATALVLTGVQVVADQQMHFGSIAQGTTKTVGLNGSVVGPTQQGNETLGIFRVTADLGASVTYTLTTPTNLTNTGIDLPITFFADYRTNNTLTPVGTTAQQNLATVLTMPADELFFYLGGTITVAANQARGTYTGTVTLNVTYN